MFIRYGEKEIKSLKIKFPSELKLNKTHFKEIRPKRTHKYIYIERTREESCWIRIKRMVQLIIPARPDTNPNKSSPGFPILGV